MIIMTFNRMIIKCLLIVSFFSSITSCSLFSIEPPIDYLDSMAESIYMVPLVYDDKLPININNVTFWMDHVTKKESNQGAD